MEILPVDAIRDDLEAMALVRMELFRLQHLADKQLIELNLKMLRTMGTTGMEYELSDMTAKAMSMLSAAREKVRKDGMIGQLELKSGVVETLEKEQYHEKEDLEEIITDESVRKIKEGQNDRSVMFIANQMGARMRQISLSEEDFYYYVKDLIKLWREYEKLLPQDSEDDTQDPLPTGRAYDITPDPFRTGRAHDITPDPLRTGSAHDITPDPLRPEGPDEFADTIEQISQLTENYLAGYLKVTNTIKDVVLSKQLLIVIHSKHL